MTTEKTTQEKGRIEKPTLQQLQERLWTAITTRESLPRGLHDLGLDAAYLEGFVEGDRRLDAIGRVDIYNGMYFLRLLDCIREDFPAVIAYLGDDNFYDLIADYLQDLPSISPSARDASARVPGYLRDWGAKHDAQPWLPDLAAFEWALVDIFDDADTQSLTIEAIQKMPPDGLPALPLRPVAAHRILDVQYPASSIWRAVEKQKLPVAEVPVPKPHTGQILVWRHDRQITHRAVDEAERPLLHLMRSGTTFGLLCEHLGQTLDEATAAQTAVQTLARWANEGLLAVPT